MPPESQWVGMSCYEKMENKFPSLPYLNKLPWVKCSHEAAEGAVGKIDERRHVDSELATRVSLPCSSKELKWVRKVKV